MPHYFFNTRIGSTLIPDREGAQLRDPDQAWERARGMILQLLREQGARADLLTATIEVMDEAGEIVLEFPFADAIAPGNPPVRH